MLPAQTLSFLGIGTQQTGLLGALLAVITLSTVALLALLLARKWKFGLFGLVLAQALLSIAAISPGVILGVERGQIEQLTMALVVIALITLPRSSGVGVIGIATSFFATITKYLTIGLFLAFLSKSTLTRRHWAVLVAMASSALFLLLSVPELQTAADASRSGVPQTTVSAFGLTASLATPLSMSALDELPSQGAVDNWAKLRVAGLLIFAVGITVTTYLLRRITLPPQFSVGWTLTIGSGGVLLLPYLLGSSHDYRLIFLVPLIGGAGIWCGSTVRGLSRKVPWLVTGLATGAAATSASMVPTPQGWQWPGWALVAGDVCLFGVMVISASLVAISLWRSLDGNGGVKPARFRPSTRSKSPTSAP